MSKPVVCFPTWHGKLAFAHGGQVKARELFLFKFVLFQKGETLQIRIAASVGKALFRI